MKEYLILSMLSVFVLLLSRSASGQLSVSGNDNVTVDGTGTHGVYQGQPISNSTTYYSGAPAVSVSNDAAFSLGSGGVLNSASIHGLGLAAQTSGPVSITVGMITGSGTQNIGLAAFGNGPITVSGGTIIAGGDSSIALAGEGNQAFTVSGGTFTADDGFALFAFRGDTTVIGGSFAGGFDDFDAEAGADIDLYGSFSIGGAQLAPGTTESLPTSASGSFGTFTGTLENDSVGQEFDWYNSGTITLHDVDVPEPSPTTVGTLGIGVVALISRRFRLALKP